MPCPNNRCHAFPLNISTFASEASVMTRPSRHDVHNLLFLDVLDKAATSWEGGLLSWSPLIFLRISALKYERQKQNFCKMIP
jgi:hypothetical protein